MSYGGPCCNTALMDWFLPPTPLQYAPPEGESNLSLPHPLKVLPQAPDSVLGQDKKSGEVCLCQWVGGRGPTGPRFKSLATFQGLLHHWKFTMGWKGHWQNKWLLDKLGEGLSWRQAISQKDEVEKQCWTGSLRCYLNCIKRKKPSGRVGSHEAFICLLFLLLTFHTPLSSCHSSGIRTHSGHAYRRSAHTARPGYWVTAALPNRSDLGSKAA